MRWGLLSLAAPLFQLYPRLVLSVLWQFHGRFKMPQTSGHATNNSAASMLVPDQASSSAPSPVTTSSTCMAPAFASPSITLSQQDLTQAFSQALGESLSQILAAFQSHSSPSLPSLVSYSTTSASPLAGNSASVTAFTTSSATYLTFPSATGNISVPSFISTYWLRPHLRDNRVIFSRNQVKFFDKNNSVKETLNEIT